MDKFSEMSHAERIAYLASKVALAKSYDSPVLTVPIPDLEILLAELEAKDQRIDELEYELACVMADNEYCRKTIARKDAAIDTFVKESGDAQKRIAELERARFIAWPGAMFAPVLARIKVDVKHRDGSLSVGQSAGNVVWYHSDSPSDVVAFALAVEGDEP